MGRELAEDRVMQFVTTHSKIHFDTIECIRSKVEEPSHCPDCRSMIGVGKGSERHRFLAGQLPPLFVQALLVRKDNR